MSSNVPPASPRRRRQQELARGFERPTPETDPGECAWCFRETFGDPPCPYHGEAAQAHGECS